MKTRLDHSLVRLKLVMSRSQAESYIRLGKVEVNGEVVTKPGHMVNTDDEIRLNQVEQYVSRAGMKLASVAADFKLDFKDKNILDVGSSTGGFTDFSLKRGASHVTAVDVGTNQLHPLLRGDARIDLREQTDIRDVKKLSPRPDIVVIDVSFISLRQVLPHIATLLHKESQVVAMVKPQFEADMSGLKHKGIIKNESVRRQILSEFEYWVKQYFFIADKQDSGVSGEKGNTERFYLLRKLG